MSANSSTTRRRRRGTFPWLSWLDVLALLGWGVLFLKYWLNGKLFLLIHPNYMWLTIAGGFFLIAIAAIKAVSLIQRMRQSQSSQPTVQHLTLFPPGWSSGLLVLTAILGLVLEPRAFASQTAMQRGITDSMTLTRVKPQAFRASNRSEDKTIIDWVRTLNVYPEPDAYTGQKVKVQGFAVYPPAEQMPEQYLLISRFVITCCAADVYPVGLPVKLPQPRSNYPADKWFEVEGQMITESLGGKRQLTIQAKSLKSIPEPKNPYDY